MKTPTLASASAVDASKIKKQLDQSESIKQKKQAMLMEIDRLKNDAKSYAQQIGVHINDFVHTKQIGDKLEKLMKKYEVKMKRDELMKIRLADRVQIRKELKEKLLKEVEGLRTLGNQYANVNKVRKSDMLKIVNQIKKKLGSQ